MTRRRLGLCLLLPAAAFLSGMGTGILDSQQGSATGWFYPAGNHRSQLARGLALGDLDGDGDPDLYTADHNFEAAWRNDGGTFTIFNTVAQNDVRSVALGDLDGDGDLDAFVGGGEENGNGAPSRVRFNQGSLTFTDSGQALGQAETASVALGDLDGDGDLDAATVNVGASNLVWINQGGAQGGTEGNFAAGPQSLGSGVFGTLALGDLDGDGDLEAVVPDGGLARIYRNDGLGMLTDTGLLLGTVATFPHVALGDLDGDGDLDAFVSTRTAETIWRNETPTMGPISFTDTGQRLGIDVRDDNRGVALADLDADGDLDAVVARKPRSTGVVLLSEVPLVTLTVWLNDGSGGFRLSGECFAPATFVPEGGPVVVDWAESPVLADLDGDGAVDLVTSHADGFRWWFNGAPAGSSPCCALERSAYGADAGLQTPPQPRPPASREWEPLRSLSEAVSSIAGTIEEIDVGTYFAVRDLLLPDSANGQRYLDFYAAHNSELISVLASDPQLAADGAMALALWSDNLLALLQGNGASTVITSQEIDAIDTFLADVAAAGSSQLAQAITSELAANPPLQSLVGQTMDEARTLTIGPAAAPIFVNGFESGDTTGWSQASP